MLDVLCSRVEALANIPQPELRSWNSYRLPTLRAGQTFPPVGRTDFEFLAAGADESNPSGVGVMSDKMVPFPDGIRNFSHFGNQPIGLEGFGHVTIRSDLLGQFTRLGHVDRRDNQNRHGFVRVLQSLADFESAFSR
jgi:hypothetical protein